jgi:hypothetical protein
MKHFNHLINQFYKYQGFIYKLFLFALSTFLIVYFFPKGAQFKYDFTKNQVWQYDDFYAPFSFALYKSNDQIEEEKEKIKENHIPYFEFDKSVWNDFETNLTDSFTKLPDSISVEMQNQLYKFTKNHFEEVYQNGVVENE